MHIIKARNINEAFFKGISLLTDLAHTSTSPSRNGDVVRVNEPVCTAYYEPTKRVLTNRERNANPFFHFMESMWMLAGRNDIDFVARFNKQMRTYTDDGSTQPAAYGYRWRRHFEWDQIDFVISQLRANSDTRRCVISMWDPNTDNPAQVAGGKDVPCNTTIFFLKRADGRLDMTVTNRSNDAIWGCYGANAVHMSFLHEYVASSVKLPLGTYYQISNDLHYYTDIFSGEKLSGMWAAQELNYPLEPLPLLAAGETIDEWQRDLRRAMNYHSGRLLSAEGPEGYGTRWFLRVFEPMWSAWAFHKRGDYDMAVCSAERIAADDWRAACLQYINTTHEKRSAKV